MIYSTYKIFLSSDATTFDLENIWAHSLVYQVVWSWSLWFSFYPAYKIFRLSDATTFDFEKQ
jgi:hypothetical protein